MSPSGHLTSPVRKCPSRRTSHRRWNWKRAPGSWSSGWWSMGRFDGRSGHGNLGGTICLLIVRRFWTHPRRQRIPSSYSRIQGVGSMFKGFLLSSCKSCTVLMMIDWFCVAMMMKSWLKLIVNVINPTVIDYDLNKINWNDVMDWKFPHQLPNYSCAVSWPESLNDISIPWLPGVMMIGQCRHYL